MYIYGWQIIIKINIYICIYKHYKYKPIHETVKENNTVVTLLIIPQYLPGGYAKIKNKIKSMIKKI